jgi:hypothetical protein
MQSSSSAQNQLSLSRKRENIKIVSETDKKI